MDSSKLTLARQGHRITNFIVDMVAFFIIWIVFSLGLIIMGVDQNLVDGSGEEMPIVPLILLVPNYWGYYFITEYFFQRTLGKLITRTKVVTLTGEKPSVKHVIIRTLSRSIPFEYISYLVMVDGIHDRLSKTRVILV